MEFKWNGLEKEVQFRYSNFDEIIEELKDLIFLKKEITPYLDKNNRGSLTNHYILSGRNKEKCEFYFDLLYMEKGLKSQIEGNYQRIKIFLSEYLESIEYNIEDKFDYINFFNFLEGIYDDLSYELFELYVSSQILELIRNKEKELRIINNRGDEAFSSKDYSLAMEEYKISSLYNSAYGCFRIGELYELGLGVSINIEKALEFYFRSKKMNYIPAIKKIAEFHYVGKHLGKNHDESFKLFRKASEMGDIESQELLARCYKEGIGVTVNYEEAFKWYMESYEKGNKKSSVGLAYLYENGFGVPQDIEKSVFFYKIGVIEGDIVSALALAFIKEKQESYIDAFSLFEKAAYAGNDIAQFKLGEYYCNGKVEKSAEKGIFWLEKAAEKDNLDSLNLLGKYYEDKNIEKALEYFQRALKFHDKDANFNIANYYLDKEFEKAKKYFTRAFEFGKIDSFYILGKAYLEGIFIEKNVKEAKYYLERAIEKGDLNSKFLLGKILLDPELGIRNFHRAFILLEEASDFGNKEAMLILADLYEQGLGVMKNINEADRWRNLARENLEEIENKKQNIFEKIKKILHR